MEKASDEVQETLQNWLEQTLLPVLREGSLLAPIAAEQMTDEISQLARTDEAGQVFAPDQFTISIHPDATVGLGSSLADIHGSLSQSLEDLLRDVGYRFRRRLHVTLATDPTLDTGAVKVIAWHSKDPLNVTKELSPKKLGERSAMPADAFLMVEGRRHFPLERAEVRVGRLLENDLVLKDPHVSRRHALLRLEKGQYVLYDLRSTAGTKVNGKAVLSQALYPGDVIEVGNVEMVYGEGADLPPSKSASYMPPSEEPEKQSDVTPLDLKKFDFPTRSFGTTEIDPEENNDAEESE